MRTLRLLFILPILTITSCMDQLKLVYEWKLLDFQYQSLEYRQRALDSKTFIPENNIPAGLEIYEDRLFVTVPRWKNGVPSSLNYIDLKNASTNSPKLIPYPSWAAHTILENSPPEIVSPFRVRADRCGHLWVLDSGKIGVLEPNSTTYPPALIIYDLKTDKLLRKYIFPAEQVDADSSFANIAVEVIDCNKKFAYASDSGKAGMVVYSWEKNESWRVQHNYMHFDPMMTNFNVNGIDFSWSLAIYGIGLSAPDSEGFATLYFHPMSSTNEFAVSTKYLREQSLVGKEFKAFKVLGSRGTNAQSSVSFLDPETGVLFYSLVSLNAVACWRTKNKSYTMENQGRIYMNNETMVYPTDIKVDYNRNLWILSNKLPLWMHGKMDFNEVNYRIYSNPILEAISHTACDIVARTDILDVAQNKKLPMPEIEPASEPAPEPTAKKTNSAVTFAPTVLGIALAISCTFKSVYYN